MSPKQKNCKKKWQSYTDRAKVKMDHCLKIKIFQKQFLRVYNLITNRISLKRELTCLNFSYINIASARYNETKRTLSTLK